MKRGATSKNSKEEFLRLDQFAIIEIEDGLLVLELLPGQ
jgi:hypothetical protein